MRIVGIIEGFYGTPWSWAARTDLVRFWGSVGGNRYLYAPKTDPLHRDRWREPYPAADVAEFSALAAAGRDAGVSVGWAVAPGLDISYAADADVAQLVAKCLVMLDAGCEHLCLALDDIPLRLVRDADREAFGDGPAGVARAQGALVESLLTAGVEDLYVVPTEYVGTTGSEYLHTLAAAVPESVDIGWTGRTVVSPAVSADDVRGWADAVGRPPLLWDNVPCNDTMMTAALHTGPLLGRSAGAAALLAGVYWNPMIQPLASRLQLATAAAWASDPEGYEPQAAWTGALAHTGGERTAAFWNACRQGPMEPAPTPVLSRLAGPAIDALPAPDWPGAWSAIAAEASAELQACDALAESGDLAGEVRPWSEQVRRLAGVLIGAVTAVQATRPVITESDTDGGVTWMCARPPSTHGAVLAWGALSMGWQSTFAATVQVHGPRVAMYPQLVQGEPGAGPGFDASSGLVLGANVVDRLAEAVLRDCGDRMGRSGALDVRVDGEPVEVDADGWFRVPDGGRRVRLEAAGAATECDAGVTTVAVPDLRMAT